MTEQERFEAWAEFMRNPPPGTVFTITKHELRSLMDAADQALDGKEGAVASDVLEALPAEHKGDAAAKFSEGLVQAVTDAVAVARDMAA